MIFLKNCGCNMIFFKTKGPIKTIALAHSTPDLNTHWEFEARFISKLSKYCFCRDLIFSGTSSLKRQQEAHKSLKKAINGCKGHFKGQRVKKWKNIDFTAFLCSFGVKNEEDSVFRCFKVIKAKKATLVARKAKSHRSNAKNL